MISIIIPALNEEKYLPRLLQSIKEQDFEGDLEVIVADAGSKDKTREIAKKFGYKIVKGGHLPKGRNEGAKVAHGDILLFIDADVALPKNFLKDGLREFLDRNLDGATFFIQPAEGKNWQRLLLDVFYNCPVKLLARIIPFGSMVFLIKREVHQRINGFNEEIIFIEDGDYIRRLKRTGKHRFIKSVSIFASTRRFQKDGWIIGYLKLIMGYIYTVFIGPIKTNIFNYKFNHYDHKNLPR